MVHLTEKMPRRQEPPVSVTISLPHRLHGVFSQRAREKGLRLSTFVEQLIEVAWSQANGVAEAAPVVVEPSPPAVDIKPEPASERIDPPLPAGVRATNPSAERIIRGMRDAGWSPREIARDYPYTEDQVREVRFNAKHGARP